VPESELLGAHIFVICNLKYAKLKGVESQGMVLCACAIDAAGNKGVRDTQLILWYVIFRF
jgi:tRNA-binding EMAP/Myf-like protein